MLYIDGTSIIYFFKLIMLFFDAMFSMAKKKSMFETQFSIYKVDSDNSIKYFKENYEINVNSFGELQNQILITIENVINEKNCKKKCVDISHIEKNDFKGLAFKTYHYPSWCGMIRDMLDEDLNLSNTHISYIL